MSDNLSSSNGQRSTISGSTGVIVRCVDLLVVDAESRVTFVEMTQLHVLPAIFDEADEEKESLSEEMDQQVDGGNNGTNNGSGGAMIPMDVVVQQQPQSTAMTQHNHNNADHNNHNGTGQGGIRFATAGRGHGARNQRKLHLGSNILLDPVYMPGRMRH